MKKKQTEIHNDSADSAVDRRVLAKLRGCKCSNYLEGAGCTKNCDHRDTCKIKRVKLLIQALSLKLVFEKTALVQGIPVSFFKIKEVRPDEYIAEISGIINTRMV